MDGFTLKWIALFTMIIDHTGMVLFPHNLWFRIVGRLAFPIYCFLLVEGAVHTSDRKRYLRRLLAFALISEIPFDLVCSGCLLSWGQQNVFFTLFLGLSAVLACQNWWEKEPWGKSLAVGFSVVAILVAEYGNTDYGGGGVLLILIFFVFREHRVLCSIVFAAAILLIYGGLESYAILSLLPIWCYNEKRGPGLKYFFYGIYPVHLLLLYGISVGFKT